MGTYIINFDDKPWKDLDDEQYYRCSEIPWFSTTKTSLHRLIPYTEPDLEQIRKEAYDKCMDEAEMSAYKLYSPKIDEAYQQGLYDAWEAARKIASDNAGRNYSIFGQHFTAEILNTHTASECIEEIRAYEQAQKEKEEEKSSRAEDVMRQYLDTFCKGHGCGECILYTSDFTCGRGYHFLTNRVSDEEVRRAYATVLAKMKE